MASTIWSGTKTFTATGGAESVVPVPMPHRGVLRGYSLVQLTGNDDGITADLYTSNQATAPNASLPEEAFHLISVSDAAETTTDPDVVAIAENNNLNIAYLNRDGSPSNPQRFLYLRITPGGAGAKNFVLTVTVENASLTT